MWLQHIVISLKYPISFLYGTDLVAVHFFVNVLVKTDRQIWESLESILCCVNV